MQNCVWLILNVSTQQQQQKKTQFRKITDNSTDNSHTLHTTELTSTIIILYIPCEFYRISMVLLLHQVMSKAPLYFEDWTKISSCRYIMSKSNIS